jgi:hypothetical protein
VLCLMMPGHSARVWALGPASAYRMVHLSADRTTREIFTESGYTRIPPNLSPRPCNQQQHQEYRHEPEQHPRHHVMPCPGPCDGWRGLAVGHQSLTNVRAGVNRPRGHISRRTGTRIGSRFRRGLSHSTKLMIWAVMRSPSFWSRHTQSSQSIRSPSGLSIVYNLISPASKMRADRQFLKRDSLPSESRGTS